MTKQTAALLVDGNNVSGGLGNKRLDVERLRTYLESTHNLILNEEEGGGGCHYFMAVSPTMDKSLYDRHRSFRDMLIGKNYRVAEKLMRRSGEGWKGDCDMLVALAAADVLTEKNVDWILIMSNDSDFGDLIEFVHRKAKKAAIITVDGDAAIELRNVADLFIDLSDVEGIFFPPGRLRRRTT